MLETLPNQLRLQYRLLNHEGFLTRVRCHNTNENKTICEERVQGEDELVKWAERFSGKGNLFLGRAPLNAKGDVVCATAFSLDIDPVRDRGTASSSDQHSKALRLGRDILGYLGEGHLCSSGNGALILIPFGEPVREDLDAFVLKSRAFEQQIRSRFETSEVKIDATHDLRRLIKAMGFTSTKGDPSQWRVARFLSGPVFYRKRSRIREAINGISVSVPQLDIRKLDDINDRSAADFALAVKCHKGGFTASQTFAALMEHAYRPGREDDYKRIVGKLYTGEVHGREPGAPVPNLSLWTPGEGSAVNDFLTELDKRNESGSERLATGFKELDDKIWQLPRGELSVFAARSGYGKTSFACTVAEFLRAGNKRVLFFSTEMHRFRIFEKLCSVSKEINSFEFTSGRLSEGSKQRIRDYGNSLGKLPIYLCDDSNPTLEQVRGKVNELRPDVFIFDHINWIASERTAIRDYFKGLKRIARENACGGIVMAQLNEPPRDLKNGGFLASDRSDIRESKDLITDAAVLVLWSNDGQPEGPMQLVSVKIAKGRFGGMDSELNLVVDKRYGKFCDSEANSSL